MEIGILSGGIKLCYGEFVNGSVCEYGNIDVKKYFDQIKILLIMILIYYYYLILPFLTVIPTLFIVTLNNI